MLPLVSVQPFRVSAEEVSSQGEHTWFYNQLNETEQTFYQAINALYTSGRLKDGNASEDVMSLGISTTQLEQYAQGDKTLAQAFHNARDAFQYDHADIFYVNYEKLSFRVGKTSNGYTASVGNGSYETYYADGFTSRTQVDAAQKEVENVRASMMNAIPQDASIKDKITSIHDQIIAKVTYTYADEAGVDAPYVDGIYGALVKGKAQCGGYAQAFKYIMDELDIPTILVFGVRKVNDEVNELHMWNDVKIGNYWYGMDVTWDDPIGGSLRYNYFLEGNAVFDIDHMEVAEISPSGKSFNYPLTNNESYQDYIARHDTTFGFQVTGEPSETGTGMMYTLSYNNMGQKKLSELATPLTFVLRMYGNGGWNT